ncbi:MAG: hypothetical protein AAFR99_10415 [Cyanobacteria bacterium J06629_9]
MALTAIATSVRHRPIRFTAQYLANPSSESGFTPLPRPFQKLEPPENIVRGEDSRAPFVL